MAFTFDARQRTRTTDPVTSHEAGESVDGAASRAAVFAELCKVDFGLADFELQKRLADRWSPERVRTARHELAEQGRVEFTGTYHLTPRGRRAQVWAAVEA